MAGVRTTCAKEIADWWRDKIKADLSGSGELNLATCMSSSLDGYPADFSADVNAVFVWPIDDVPESVGGLGSPGGMLDIQSKTWRDVYRFRAVWVSPMASAAGEHQEANRAKVQRLADTVRAYPTMLWGAAGAPSLPAAVAQVELAVVDRIDFRPPEDTFEATLKARLVAAAIEFRVFTIASTA